MCVLIIDLFWIFVATSIPSVLTDMLDTTFVLTHQLCSKIVKMILMQNSWHKAVDLMDHYKHSRGDYSNAAWKCEELKFAVVV